MALISGLMISDAEHVFTWLLAICASSASPVCLSGLADGGDSGLYSEGSEP